MAGLLARRTATTLLVQLGPVVAAVWPVIPASWTVQAYLLVMALSIVAVNLVRDPVSNLSREGEDQGSEALLGVCMWLGSIWAGLDVGRWHLTNTVPETLQLAALATLFVASGLRLWAMAANRYFANLLWIQRERGHQVIDTGPYGWVRHPGYTTFLLILPSMALSLSSWSALGPMLLGVAVVVRRTAREDAFLHQQLPGYPAYAQSVRFRLVPGLY